MASYNSPQTPVGNPQNVVKIKGHDATYAFAAFLNEDGQIWSTGYNGYGQLGRGDLNQKTTFGKVRMSKGTVYTDFDLVGYNSGTAMIAVTDKDEIMTAGYSAQFTTTDPYPAGQYRPVLSRAYTAGEKSPVSQITNSDVSITGTVYVIKAIPDEVIDTSLSITNNLSATLDGITQTVPFGYITGDVEIGLKSDVTVDNLVANNQLTTTDLETTNINFADGTVQDTAPTITPYWNVLLSNINNRTTVAEMKADRLNSNFKGEWVELSRGTINTGYNNSAYPSTNSLMYTMWVDNTGADELIRMYNYSNDDRFYVHVDEVNVGTYNNFSSSNGRIVDFTVPSGVHRIDIVKNDYGNGSNQFELMGDLFSGDLKFVEDDPYDTP